MKERAALALALLLAVPAAAHAQESPPSLDDCPDVGWPEPVDPELATSPQEVVVRVDVAPTGELTVVPVAGPAILAEQLARLLPACAVTPAARGGLPVPGSIELHWDFPAVAPNLAGHVVRRGDRAPVAGATVTAGGRSTRTDADGAFSFVGLAPGPVDVAITAVGASAPPTPVTIAPGRAVDVTIRAFPERADDDVLLGIWSEPVEPEVHVTTTSDARATPGSLGDPLRALHADPALSRTPFDAGWLLVRGGDYDDTATFVDGVPTPLLYHLGGFTSILHPELTKAVRFWPDGAPVRFGEAVTGAAEVALADPPERQRLEGGVNLVYADALAEGRLGDGAGYQVAARRSYLDAVLTAAIGADAARIAPRFYDGVARFAGPGWSVTALGVSDVFDAPTGEGTDVVSITQGGGQLQGRFERGRFSVVPWVSERVQQLADPEGSQRIVEWFPGARGEWALPDGPLDGYAGLEGQVHSFLLTQGNDRRSAPVITGAPYVALGAGGERLYLHGGLRVDGAWIPGQPLRGGPAPQAGFDLDLAKHLTWTADWGRWHQLPDAVYLIALPDGGYLDSLRADSGSTGLRYAPGPVEIAVDTYVRAEHDVPGFEADGSLGPLVRHAAGIESSVRVHRESWDLSALYTFVDTWQAEEVGGVHLLSPYDRPHRLEVVGVARLPRDLLVSGRFRYTSGYPRRDELEAYDVLTDEMVPLGTGDRLAAYHALDLKIVRPFAFRTWRLDASLDVLNVYNRRVPEPVITGFGDTDPAFGFGLPILPIFGVSASYWP